MLQGWPATCVFEQQESTRKSLRKLTRGSAERYSKDRDFGVPSRTFDLGDNAVMILACDGVAPSRGCVTWWRIWRAKLLHLFFARHDL